MRVGDLTIDAVVDGVARSVPSEAFRWGASPDGPPGKGLDEADWVPHREFLAEDGMLEMALGGFLVRGGGDRVVLVDAGLGPFTRGVFQGGAMLDNLRALGVEPTDVTDVVFTHLHFDHVGWATQQGSPVFENATYRCHEHDWSHFVPGDERATKKLAPLESRLELFAGDGPLLPGIDVRVAPGHTPGSTIVILSSGEERALLLGDVVHCPVELLDDEWATIGDVDAALAKRTRIALAKELEGDDVPVAAAHVPGLEFGRLVTGASGRRWV